MDPEIVTADTPVDLVRQGERLMRIENDTMLQIATQRPRDEGKITKAALQELDLNPEQAKAAFYSIPYKERVQGEPGKFKVTKVEGGSIKAAMALARRWGNCTVGGRVMSEDELGWDLEGVFIDLESNFRVSRPFRVSKSYKSRAGEVVFMSVDRQLQALQSGASKAIRNAVLSGLPAYLVNAYTDKAKVIAGGKLDATPKPETIQALINAYQKMHVTQEELEQYVGLPIKQWLGQEVADLRGLWNALQDGQVKVSEVFGTEAEEPGGTDSPYQDPQPKADAPKEQPAPAPEEKPRVEETKENGAPGESFLGGLAPEPDPPKAQAEPTKKAKPKDEKPLTGAALRQGCWTRILADPRIIDKKSTGSEVLFEHTGKRSLASMSDQEVADLYKKLG